MSNRKLSVLAICAVILAGWAILQTRLSAPREITNMVNAPLITGLDIEAINGIEIKSPKGSEKVKLARQSGGFVVIDKDGYPANTKSINDLITNCLDIRTTELCSKDPVFHEDLGVSEQTARYVISFLDKEDKPFLTLFISDSRPDTQNCYVRLGWSDATYLSIGSPLIRTSPIDYIDTKLTSVQTNDISSVTVVSPQQSYTLKKNVEQDQIELENTPAGKRLAGTTYKQVFNALGDLRFEDVMAKSSQMEGLKFENRYICQMADSTVYTLELAKKDQKTYLTVAAEFTDKTDVVKEKTVESQQQLKGKEARLLARDHADEFAQQHAGWVYVLPEYKAKDLTKDLSELLEDIPAETGPRQQAAKEPNQPAMPEDGGFTNEGI